jgi:hypothetical protein
MGYRNFHRWTINPSVGLGTIVSGLDHSDCTYRFFPGSELYIQYFYTDKYGVGLYLGGESKVSNKDKVASNINNADANNKMFALRNATKLFFSNYCFGPSFTSYFLKLPNHCFGFASASVGAVICKKFEYSIASTPADTTLFTTKYMEVVANKPSYGFYSNLTVGLQLFPTPYGGFTLSCSMNYYNVNINSIYSERTDKNVQPASTYYSDNVSLVRVMIGFGFFGRL